MKARRWRHGALLGVVLVVALTAAGCGEKSDSGGGSTGTTAAAPTVDEALAAKVPDAVKSDGKIVIGTDASYAPNEFLDTDGKTVIGFDVDLFNAVAAKLGLKTEYESAVFDAIIPGLQSGKYETGVSSFTINDERKKQVNMVSYFNAGTQWGTKKGNPTGIQPDNACGKKVAVQTNTV
ncbi:MAG TPA: transporter substrate-binding domain-containing protein, partial [Actinomycetota bacterium]